MMPILPLVRVRNADEGIDFAVEVEHGYRHTASMHSRNIDMRSKMARAMDCSIFVKNGPHASGLERRGSHQLHHRESHGRRHDDRAQLHAPAPLHVMTASDRMSHVAIAAIETSSIAQGIVVADAMVKQAEVDVLEASTLARPLLDPDRRGRRHGARVAQARRRGRGGHAARPAVHPAAARGQTAGCAGLVPPNPDDAYGVIETLTAASAIVAADLAAKAAEITLRDLRLANGLGGRASSRCPPAERRAGRHLGRQGRRPEARAARALGRDPRLDPRPRPAGLMHFARVIGTVVCTEKVLARRASAPRAAVRRLGQPSSVGRWWRSTPVSAAPGQFRLYVPGREASDHPRQSREPGGRRHRRPRGRRARGSRGDALMFPRASWGGRGDHRHPTWPPRSSCSSRRSRPRQGPAGPVIAVDSVDAGIGDRVLVADEGNFGRPGALEGPRTRPDGHRRGGGPRGNRPVPETGDFGMDGTYGLFSR